MSKYQALIDALAYAKQTGGIGLTASVADLDALLADLERAEKALAAIAHHQAHPVPAPVDERDAWLPIESAPKDGRRLILWWGGKPVLAGWLDNSQCKHPWAGWQTPSLTPRPQGEPTHYMSLPPAPPNERPAMSEDHIWKVAQSVGFDDYELRPMLEAFAAALSQPAPSPQAPGGRKGPPGITLEPQGHEPPAVPVVSDDILIEREYELVMGQHLRPQDRAGVLKVCRAILTLRPTVDPMTPEQMRKAAMDEMGKIPALANHHSWKGWPGTWAFATAAVNGITAKAEGGA